MTDYLLTSAVWVLLLAASGWTVGMIAHVVSQIRRNR